MYFDILIVLSGKTECEYHKIEHEKRLATIGFDIVSKCLIFRRSIDLQNLAMVLLKLYAV